MDAYSGSIQKEHGNRSAHVIFSLSARLVEQFTQSLLICQSHYYFSKFTMLICCHCCLHVHSLFFVEMMPGNGRRRGRPKRIRSRDQSRRQLNAPQCSTTKRQKSHKQWSMLAAQEAVRQGMSVSRVAAVHGVPRITLYDRHSGSVKHAWT